MKKKEIYLGNNILNSSRNEVKGQFIEINNEKYYKISNHNEMADFFISIVSDSDHWMFISSNGSLSAGRKDRDNAIFPYSTVDKIHDSKDLTGNKTVILAEKGDKTYLWEPFLGNVDKVYKIEKTIMQMQK